MYSFNIGMGEIQTFEKANRKQPEKALKRPRKYFNIVKVRDSGVRETTN